MRRIPYSIPSSTDKSVIHGVTLVFSDDGEFIPEASNCTCIWGSWYRWRKKNKTVMCQHIKKAFDEYELQELTKFKELIIKNERPK